MTTFEEQAELDEERAEAARIAAENGPLCGTCFDDGVVDGPSGEVSCPNCGGRSVGFQW